MKFAVLLLLVAFYFSGAMGQFVINQNFTITVRGTFRQDVAGFPCEFCDCTANDVDTSGNTPCSIWNDTVTCNATLGPDDNQQRWGRGSGSTFCTDKSGVGFQGVSGVIMTANDPVSTRIGAMTHYNNPIQAPSPTRLQLLINMTAPELEEEFQSQFPLTFIETPNLGNSAECDPSIQKTTTPCDDRFSFNAYTITQSFLSNNIRYTLVITGFLQPQFSDKPISQFVTEERKTSRADVFARIVTFCEEVDCPVNEIFEGAPTCGCVCILTNDTCKTIFGDNVAVETEDCECKCAKTGEELGCNETLPFNPDTCSCGCNVTNEYCRTVNPLFEADLGSPGECECVCNRQAFIDCRATNTFFAPLGDKCLCGCAVTDDICKELFGSKYKADLKKCGCVVPGGDTGLTDEEIAGIVVASVVGPILIVAFVLLLAGILAYLILAGYIPGIYGYKIAQGSFAGGGNSPMYADPWVSNTNAAA